MTAGDERVRAMGALTGEAEIAAVLAASDLAAHIRDARSNEDPCAHWVGQGMAVCSPCLRDRITPHVAAVLAPIVAARVAAAWDEGFDAGDRDVWEHEEAGWRDDHPCIPNPYRAALTAAEPTPAASEEA